MSSTAGWVDGWLPLWLVGLSGFVLALLSAYLPRPVGAALVVVALSGAVAAATMVARQGESVFRATLPGLGPAAGAAVAGVLLDPNPMVAELPLHLASGLGLGVCAVLVGFAIGVVDVRVRDGGAAPHRRDLVGFVGLLVLGAALVAATAPYVALHAPL